MERRLVAILAADVAGYSHLMELDEEAATATLRAYRIVVEEAVGAHHGRVFSIAGDSIVAEFHSIVDAIHCAVEIQQAIAEHNATLPANRRMQFRIGVNLGDVLAEESALYGTGVNVAARIEQLAEPGGVCVSQPVYDQVRKIVEMSFEDIGEFRLKNIADSVRVYRILSTPLPWSGRLFSRRRRRGAQRLGYLVAGIALLLATVALAIDLGSSSGLKGALVGTANRLLGRETQVAELRSVVPGAPPGDSIAVLPFLDLSGRPDDDPFVDGIFDDLLTDLSKIRSLTVMARNSVESYRGNDVAPLTVAADLSVRYILEGSVRRTPDNLRINARLIDSRGQQNIWAQSYSGPVTDMFNVQNELVEDVVNSLAVQVSNEERARIFTRETENIDAYDAFQRGEASLLAKTPEELPVALAEFQKAVTIDPGYSRAYAAIGQVYWNAWVWGWESYVGETWETAPDKTREYLAKALARPTANAYQLASDVNLYARKFDDSLEFARLAVEFAPNDPSSDIVMAEALIYGGSPAEAIPWVDVADRLERNIEEEPPSYNVWVRAMAHFGQDEFEAAIPLFETALMRNPEDFGPAAPLAAAYWHLAEQAVEADPAASRAEEHRARARAALDQYFAGWPEANIEEFIVYWPFRETADEARLLEPLRALGMPEVPPE